GGKSGGKSGGKGGGKSGDSLFSRLAGKGGSSKPGPKSGGKGGGKSGGKGGGKSGGKSGGKGGGKSGDSLFSRLAGRSGSGRDSSGAKGSKSSSRGLGRISDLLGKGKKSRKAPTDPSTLTPPPVQPSTTRRPVDTDGPADETPSGSIPEGQQETDTIPERRSSGQYTGGDAGMGRIHEAAQELAEAIRRHPLENTKDMETFLEDLGLAGNLIAEAETAAAGRVHEEFPADAQ